MKRPYSCWLILNPIGASPPATITATQLTDFGTDQFDDEGPLRKNTKWNSATTAKINPATKTKVRSSMSASR